jgi:hypothetical protein
MKREKNEQIKDKNNILENHIIENFKKYYNIDDHTDLLKFIKKHIIIIIIIKMSSKIIVNKFILTLLIKYSES